MSTTQKHNRNLEPFFFRPSMDNRQTLLSIIHCPRDLTLQFSTHVTAVCILLSVCILPLVRSLQFAVRSLRFTLTD